MSDDTYNASDRSDVRASATAARLAQRSDDDVVRGLMRTVAGRQWLYNLLSRCHLSSTTFSGDALQSAFREGERNIGLMLLAEVLRTSPDEYIMMVKEAHGRDTTNDITRRNRRSANGSSDDADPTAYVDYGATLANAEPGDSAVQRDEE